MGAAAAIALAITTVVATMNSSIEKFNNSSNNKSNCKNNNNTTNGSNISQPTISNGAIATALTQSIVANVPATMAMAIALAIAPGSGSNNRCRPGGSKSIDDSNGSGNHSGTNRNTD